MTQIASGVDRPWRVRDAVLVALNGIMAALAGVAGVLSGMDVLVGADKDGRAAAGYFVVRAVVIALAVLILAIQALITRRPSTLPVMLLGAAVVLGALHLIAAWLLRRR